MLKKRIHLLFLIFTLVFLMTGFSRIEGIDSNDDRVSHIALESKTNPKYVFMFIGDGMSQVQVNAAQMYQGNKQYSEIRTKPLNFTKFPVLGLVTTYNASSFIPDSASTATALSSGIKTLSGMIGVRPDNDNIPQSITEKVKLAGKKVGIVTSVTINHATPAAYYAHVRSRSDYYEIANQLAISNFDYFAGGSILEPMGSDKNKPNVYDIITESGYKIIRTKEEFFNLNASSDKVYVQSPALQDNGALPYAIDAKDSDLTLADFVNRGVKVLDNEEGFFMMVESGKIDWACHANDAMTVISEVLAFEAAIEEAVKFANEHPDETLIIVTGDHETGGMSIGYAKTGYTTALQLLTAQKMSYIAFDELIEKMKVSNPNLTFNDIYPLIKENFGLISPFDKEANFKENSLFVMTDDEWNGLNLAFEHFLHSSQNEKETTLFYGGYNPLSVTLTHLLNHKAGIGWTTYAHTGAPVALYAMGVGADYFDGFYDNIDVFEKLLQVCGLE